MCSKKLTATICAVLLIITSLLTACGSSESNQSSGQQPDKNQTLNLFFESPTTLDVNDVRNSSEFQILSQVQEGLVRTYTDKNGKEKTVPAGAKSWKITNGGTVYTFKLRNYKWSDGKEVTAQNYVDSVLRLLDPKKAFSYAFFAYDIKNAEKYYAGKAKAKDVGVKALDDKTLQFTLEKPTPQFNKKFGFVALFPIRLDVIKKGGETYATDYKAQVFSGPFVIKSWVKDNSLVLKKNPKYWDAKNVHLKTVNLKKVDETSTQASLFQSKQTDVIAAQQQYIKKWAGESKQGKIQYIHGNTPLTSYIVFNQKSGGTSGLLKNAKIRLALSLAINREDLVKLVFGRYRPAYGLIPNGIQVGNKDYRDDVAQPLKPLYDKYNGNKSELQELFKEGLKELGVKKRLSDITFTLITTGTDALSKSEQEYYQQEWEKNLGVKVKLNVLESKLFVAQRNANKYDLLLNGWFGDYNDPSTFTDMWTANNGFSKFFGFYSDKKYDAYYKKLDGVTDDAQREKIYAQLEDLLIAKDAGVAPIYYGDSQYFVQNYVKNISFPLFGTPIDFSRAYISGKE
ncbi:peptide ABC transporter substrate-binding protein [Sporolactobacillus shoreicorticis]|uniref:Peptide ABC transporter substrate-binding protein n=1 Tax=Sporolactobacillus shoreicorticis TaxID=1923877 RepID=A0ABW5S3A4_9BACL|nr:peptide ABC transporter substrate-binding protein [Sporolactobacillus shoreicorticis]MCO7127073.1 peptide ABC transporter substrate-binding protein [Sporolactobacillus shoreicorticis]